MSARASVIPATALTAVLILLFVATTSVAAQPGCTPISTSMELSAPGCYVLTDNVTTTDTVDSGIAITSDDVILDGGGYYVDGRSAPSFSNGVRIGDRDSLNTQYTTQYTNVTVRNVNVLGWHEGVKVQNASATVTDVNFAANTNGLVMERGFDSTITDNVHEGDKYAVSFVRSRDLVVERNVIRAADDGPEISRGLQLYASKNATLRDNSISDVDQLSFFVQGSVIDRSPHQFVHDVDTSNTVDGKPIYYYVGESGLTLDAPTNVGFLAIANSTDVTVRNFDQTATATGLLVANSEDVHLEGLDLSGNYYGLSLYGTTNATLTNSHVNANERFGVLARDVVDTTVDEATVNFNRDPGHGDRAALWVDDGLRTAVRNSTFHGNRERAIRIGGTATTVTENDIRGTSGGSGIFTGGDDATVTDNEISHHYIGIGAFAENGLVANNTITTTTTGIEANGDGTTVRDNEITDAQDYGVDVSPSAVTLRNNSITASRWGIYVDNTDPGEAVLRHNTLTGNDRAIVLESAEGVTIANNDVRNSAEWAFYAYDDSRDADVVGLDVGFPLAFTGTDVAMRATATPPSDPAGYRNVSRFLFVRGTESGNAENWANVTLPYDAADVTSAGVSTQSLELWRYDHGTGSWDAIPGSTHHAAARTLQGNLTSIIEDDTRTVAIMGQPGSGTTTPTATPTPTSTATATPTATDTPAQTASPRPRRSGFGGSIGQISVDPSTDTPTPTPTATPTPTPTASATPDASPGSTTGSTPQSTAADPPTAMPMTTDVATTDDDGAGFGPLLAIATLLAGVLLSRRWAGRR